MTMHIPPKTCRNENVKKNIAEIGNHANNDAEMPKFRPQ